jgi:Predicted sugar nucleotidyltransferases
MQAIIMAAGMGSRLGAITNGKPKCFVTINGESLIDRNIRMLKELGIHDIIIVIGNLHEEFEHKFGQDKEIKLVFNPFFDISNVLVSYWVGSRFLKDDFLYLHADTICEEGIFRKLINFQADIVLPVDIKPTDEEAMKVKEKDGRVIEINKTMDPKEALGEFIGICKCKKTSIDPLFHETQSLLENKVLKSYFEGAIQGVITDGLCHVDYFGVDGMRWSEIDFPEDYERAKKLFA